MTTPTSRPTATASAVRRHLPLALIGLLLPVVLLPVGVLVPLAVLGLLGAALAAAVDWARHDAFDAHHRADDLPHDLAHDLWPQRR